MSGYYDNCILLNDLTPEDKNYYEAWWLILAFFIGLPLGLVIAYCFLRTCCNSLIKKKRQDEEEEVRYTKLQEQERERELNMKSYGLQQGTTRSSLKKRLKSARGTRRRRKDDGGESSEIMETTVLTALDADNIETVEPGDGTDGMIDAVVQTTEEAGENELLKKDVASTIANEKAIRQHRIIAFAELCRLYLNKLVQAGRLEEASYEGLIEFIHNEARDVNGKTDAELKVLEEEIRNDPQLKKNPAEMDRKLEELPSKRNSLLAALLLEEQSRIVDRFAKDANLSEEEADALMSSLASDMANWEHLLAEQQNHHAARLEERLARRQQLAALSNGRQQEARIDTEAQLVAKEEQLETLARTPGRISDKQRQEILDNYRADLLRMHEAHEQNILQQQQALSERLKQLREARLKDLSKKQLLKQQEFLRQVNRVTETEDFVKAYGTLMDQQADEREAVIAELDQDECQALLGVRKNLQQDRQTQIQELEDKFLDNLRSHAGLSSDEADRLIDLHERSVNEFKRIKKMEQRMQNSKLAERLAARRQQFEDEQKRSQVEENALKNQQTATLKKTLNLQMELPEDVKDRIMKDHEQNVTSLTNQLALSRNRQRKQTEQRMAERRARVAALKRQKEDERLARRGERAKELERVEKEIDAKIAAAEKEIADAKVREMNEMRERLAAETEEALVAQEKQMSAVIAKMQVGQARRQNIIAKQDKIIEELEAKLESRLNETEALQEDDPAMRGLDQLLQTHYNQVSNLADQLQDDKERQEQILAEKLRKKRMKKERALETQIDAESGQELDKMERAGITRAGQMLMEASLDSKHRTAMNDLEKEMMVEFQREKEEMNRNMEKELEEALAEQQKNFLAQLASVARLDEREVSKVAAAAVKDAGVGGREARRFTRDFRDSFRRSTSAQGEEMQYGGGSRKKDRSDFQDEEPPRSKKSKRKKDRRNQEAAMALEDDF